MVFQVTHARKPLVSVSRMVRKGNKLVFGPDEAYIENVATGKRIMMQEQRHLRGRRCLFGRPAFSQAPEVDCSVVQSSSRISPGHNADSQPAAEEGENSSDEDYGKRAPVKVQSPKRPSRS